MLELYQKVIAIGGSVVALAGGNDNNAAPDPTGSPVGHNPVFAYGNEVFYDGPRHRSAIDDTAVKSLFYTSAGVVVRHGDNSWSDGGGPQRFSLVTPDGDVGVYAPGADNIRPAETWVDLMLDPRQA